MRKTTLLALCAFVLILAACASAATAVEPTLRQLLIEGKITQAQFDALMQALSGGGWSKFLEVASTIGGSVLATLLSLLGINKLKAPPAESKA